MFKIFPNGFNRGPYIPFFGNWNLGRDSLHPKILNPRSPEHLKTLNS